MAQNSLASIKRRFSTGQTVTVTNHYIKLPSHPCFGTQQRTIARVTASHLYFTSSGSVQWPKAAQVQVDENCVRFYGGGCGQRPDELFLTIRVDGAL